MKTLYVHIGTPKTGTSAIQWFLDRNSDVLRKKGYSYKKFPYRYRITSRRRNAHFLVGNVYDASGNIDEGESERLRAEGYAGLLSEFKECEKVIITDENLWLSFALHPEYLRRLAEWTRKNEIALKIVVYLRRRDELAESLYKQHIQAGKKLSSFSEYLESDPQLKVRLSYLENLESIAEIAGKEALIVRRFERENFPDGLIQSDFLDAVGLCMTDEYSMEGQIRNISFTNDYAEIIRILNELQEEGAPFPENNKPFNSAALALSGAGRDETELFDEKTRAEFLKKFSAEDRRIAEEFFGSAGFAEGISGQKRRWSAESDEFRKATIKFLGQAFLDINDRLNANAP